jgi:type IV secretion system protein VirB10
LSGKWIVASATGDAADLITPKDVALHIVSGDRNMEFTAGTSRWTYHLNGGESKYKRDGLSLNSVAMWEGAALLVNTLVTGPQSFTTMDRWRLSGDRTSLRVTRQIVTQRGEREVTIVYRREGATSNVTEAPTAPPASPVVAEQPAQNLAKRDAPAAGQVVVAAGTRIPLVLLNQVDSKRSQDGDRIYLETAFPITVDNRIVIPKGSSVAGTVTRAKQPGRAKGKGELYIRFDTLTLPNGVTRDFRSRLGAAGDVQGQVDRQEGKVTGESDHGADARRVGQTTSAGAAVGGIATGSGMGVGVGAAAGAAAGLASVLLKRGPDASLPRGASVEMILDRDLIYNDGDLLR